jgi:hypothetical protein
VLSWLDDEKQGYFNSNDINTWLNLAQRQVQFELLGAGQNWYQIRAVTQTIGSQADYLVPPDFIFLHRFEIIISGYGVPGSENRIALIPMTVNQQDLVPSVLGIPENYILLKDRFSLFPTPQQNYYLRLYYSPKLVDLQNDTDTPDVPEQFMEYIAIVAAFNGFIKDDRAPENLVSKKMEYLNLLKKMTAQRKQDQSRRIIETSSYDYGSYY